MLPVLSRLKPIYLFRFSITWEPQVGLSTDCHMYLQNASSIGIVCILDYLVKHNLLFIKSNISVFHMSCKWICKIPGSILGSAAELVVSLYFESNDI